MFRREFDSCQGAILFKMASRTILMSFLALCLANHSTAFEARAFQPWMPVQGPRRLFGGYRITPQHCRPSRSLSPAESGTTICMFNQECTLRKGQVVGPCMDGFLFGACCLIRDGIRVEVSPEDSVVVPESDNRLPQHPSRTTERARPSTTKQASSSLYESNEVRTSSDQDVSFKSSTQSLYTTQRVSTSDLISQIANTLLQEPPKSEDYAEIAQENQVYNYSTIKHELPDTILIEDESDYPKPINNVQVSKPQTKPTLIPSTSSQTTISTLSSTHKPLYQKPAFKPKPTKKPVSSTAFVLVETVTKPPQNTIKPSYTSSPDLYPEISSIESIIQMLNTTFTQSDLPSTTSVSPTSQKPETRHTTIEIPSGTVPVPYASGYSPINVYSSTFSSKYPISTSNYITTYKPPSTSYVYSPVITKRPGSTPIIIKKPSPNTDKYDLLSSSTSNYDQHVLEPIHTTIYYATPPTSKKPPSTSYLYSASPTKRPISSVHNDLGPPYNIPGSSEQFSSVTPTVIVLASPSSSTPAALVQEAVEADENFVEIPQDPYKKPIHQVTINNIIQSTNNINLGPNKKPHPDPDQYSTPTIVITPKPSPTTIDYERDKYTVITTPAASSTVWLHSTNQLPEIAGSPSLTSSYTQNSSLSFGPTTSKYEYQASSDDFINFPPVRNPNLNSTGIYNIFNGSITVGIDDEILQDVEFTTPSFLQEDGELDNKMSVFVSKIVGSLQGTFQELHDIVMLDKKPNATVVQPLRATTAKPGTTAKPVRKPATSRPSVTTKKPVRAPTPTTTKKPIRRPAATTKRPAVAAATTLQPATTRKPVKTTIKPKPTKKVTTTTIATTTLVEQVTEEIAAEQGGSESRQLCGVRPLVKSGRIVGGKGAAFGMYPWQVLVRESTWLGLFTKNKCGGVLITTKYVTTAAHCQPGFLASLVAVMGEHDISGDNELKRTVSRNVRRVIVHRLYDAATFENDLALLELESPIHYDSHIVPICMPPDNADFTGRMATVTGWGRLQYTGGVPAILQEVQVPIIENSVCQEMFQTAGHSKIILNSFVCAGYANGQKDSCEGDSGGPLVTERPDGRFQLVGTVSHGIKCAAPYLPGVYMRTTFYKPWLKSITGVQ